MAGHWGFLLGMLWGIFVSFAPMLLTYWLHDHRVFETKKQRIARERKERRGY